MKAWGNLLCMFCLLRSVGPSPGSSCTQLLVGFMAARLSNSLLVYFTASLINLPFKSLKHLISIKDCFIFEGNISFSENSFLLFSPFIFISWRLITLQYCSGFCHTLTWINHGFTCIPHPNPPSHLPLHSIPLGVPSAPALSTCLMHPTWAGDLFHPW